MSAQNHEVSFRTAKASITWSRNTSLEALKALNTVVKYPLQDGEDPNSMQSLGSPSSPRSPTMVPGSVRSLSDRRSDPDSARKEYLHVLESVELIQKCLTAIWPLSEIRSGESARPQTEVEALAKLYSRSLLDCQRCNIGLLKLFLKNDPTVAQVGPKAQLERVRSPRSDVSIDKAIKGKCKEVTSCIVDLEGETSSENMCRKLDSLSLEMKTATSLWHEKAGPDPNCTLWRIFKDDPFHSPRSPGDGHTDPAAISGTQSTDTVSRSLESWRLEVAATRCEEMLEYRKTANIHSKVWELLQLSRLPTEDKSVYATEREQREAWNRHWYSQVLNEECYKHLRPILSPILPRHPRGLTEIHNPSHSHRQISTTILDTL